MGVVGGEGLIAWDRATVSPGEELATAKTMGWVRERRGWVGLLPHKVKGEEEDSRLNCCKEVL